MTLLWLGFALMIAIACVMLAVPVMRSAKMAPENDESLSLSREEINASIYQQRLAELNDDYAEGRIQEAQFEELRQELDATLLADIPTQEHAVQKQIGPINPVKAILPYLLMIPVGAIIYYFTLSEKDQVSEWIQLRNELKPAIQATLARDASAAEAFADVSMVDFIRVLQHYLHTEHGEGEGWFILGSTYLDAKLYPPASQALRKAYDVDPSVPDYGIAYAQSLLAQNGGLLDHETNGILKELTQHFPSHPQARMLYGMAAYRSEHYQLAIDQWQFLLSLGQQRNQQGNEGTANEGEAILRRSIALAQEKLAQQQAGLAKGGSQQAVDKSATVTELSGASISITVEPAPEILSQIEAQHTLFVLAKAMSGPVIPLAVKRIPVADISWPVRVVLTDADAMMEQLKLSSVEQVQVIARISKDGQPIAKSGDIFGEAFNIETATPAAIKIDIAQIVP